MTEKRFEIIDCDDCCSLVDNTGNLAAIPFDFSYSNASADDHENLQKWLDFLNGDL